MSLLIHSDIFLSSITLLFLCCSLSSSSTTTTIIPPGSSIPTSNTDHLHHQSSSSSSSWSSPDRSFSLGFTQVGSNSYSFSISYLGREPIWTPGFTTVDRAGVFHFSSTGNLQLINGSGTILWDSKTDNLGINSASLDDTGNLILSKNTVPVWSTFDNPTDSIIPSQNFTKNQTLRSGSYSFRLLDSGNLSLTWNGNVMYWNQALSSAASNFSSPSLDLQPNGILQISDGYLRRSVIDVAYSNDYGEGTDVFRFLRLDKDGNFRMYSLSSGYNETTSAIVTWDLISDQCQVFGYCGNMGICHYDEELSSSPICGCPSQNFEFVDVNDGRQGCKRRVELQNCHGTATMLELKHTKFLTYLRDETFTTGITACTSNCLSSETCVATSSLSDGTGLCYMKTPDFVSGYHNPALPSTSYVKVCAPAQPNRLNSPSLSNCWISTIWIIGLATLATVLGMVGLFVCFSWWWCYKNSSQFDRHWAQYTLIEYASGAPVRFSYKELHKLTKGFKDKLGTGGFGAVYKGMLANRTEVAVKQLEGIEQGEKQFRMEVVTISSTHHLNLVRLVGFCSQGRHRLLVYEFMKNGSLDSFLFETQQRTLLTWERRFSIALGTARGITYLHEECRVCIVHCDIKPENILLDESFNARVSDFGLAKLVNTKNHHRHHQSMNVRGTRGYLAPEWLANLPITSKSDVYSYGMVLLEMVTGRRNFEVSKDTDQKKLSEWCYAEFEKGNVEAIVDRNLVQMDMEQVMRGVQVSFWCIQENPSQRPTMRKVVQMLEGVVEISRPPPLTKPLDCAAFSSFEASTPPPPPSSSSIERTAGISPNDSSLP